MNDHKCNLSRKVIDSKAKRASPKELHEFKTVKMLISICNNSSPYVLFKEILSHAMSERRSENRPKFFDTSRLKIGRQSFSNRLNIISRKINFDWLGQGHSKDTLRMKLKSSFFNY